jgi:sulfatase maturation enzyme AslB (radical SAM superfamily)
MGEPLLHSNIMSLLEIARRFIKGKIVISTNLTCVTDEISDSLLTNCDIILCSIDRWNAEYYERIRRGASFESVVANTERLLSLRKPHHRAEVVVKGLDINHHSDEYTIFQEYWSSRGARPLLAWLNDWAGTFKGMRNAAELPIPRSSQARGYCADLWFKMVINWRGDVQMCCFDWRYAFPMGKQKDANVDWIRSAWHGSKIVELRKDHLKGAFDVTSLCKTCTTWGEATEHDAYVDFNEDSYYIVF